MLIDGQSGAGKSSIIEAIVWVLFNQGRVQNRSLIRRGASSCSVELTVCDDGGKTFKILRKLDAAGKHTIDLFVSSAEDGGFVPVDVSGTKAIQAYIEKNIIGCSYKLFVNSVCYLQDNQETFVRQTPAVRKDLLLELVKADDYNQYYEKAKACVARVEQQLAGIEGANSMLASEIERNSLHVNRLEEYSADVKTLSDKITALELEQQSIITKENALKIASDNLAALRATLDSSQLKIAQVTQKQQKERERLHELTSLDAADVKTKVETYHRIKSDFDAELAKTIHHNQWQQSLTERMNTAPYVRDYTDAIIALDKQITALSSKDIPEEICANCGATHPCDVVVNERSAQRQTLLDERDRIARLQEESLTAKREHADALQEIRAREPAPADELKLQMAAIELKKLEPFLSLQATADNKDRMIEMSKGILNHCSEEIRALEISIGTTEVEISRLENESSMLDAYRSERARLGDVLMAERNKLSTATELVALAKVAKQRMQEIGKQLEEHAAQSRVLRERLNGLLMLKDAFGQNGIRAIVLDLMIPQLETRINSVLGQLSDFRVRLDTQRLNVSGETSIEGLFITILNDKNEEFDFDSYSGGERLKIIVAISEALSELQQIGFRMLDEVFLALDEESSEKFVDVILSFQERFKQLICVSHIRQVKDLFDHKVSVINTHGISRIGT